MSFEKTVNTINEYLEKKIEPEQILNKWKASWDYVFDLFNGGEPENTIKQVDGIKESVDYLCKIVLNEEISEERSEFLTAFSLVIFNWNDNTIKNIEIENQCHMIKKIVEMRFVMVDTIEVVRVAYNQLNSLQNWRVPAYDISKKHLERMLNKFKE